MPNKAQRYLICTDLDRDCGTGPLSITLTTTVGDLRTQTTDLLTGMLADVGLIAERREAAAREG